MAQVKKRSLTNGERLSRNRGYSVRLIYDLDKHKYRDPSGVHYIPYYIGSNEAKRKRRAEDPKAKHHTLYK